MGNIESSKKYTDQRVADLHEDCSVFKPGEVWSSPKDTLYKVIGYQWTKGSKRRQAVLRLGINGDGRKVLRDIDAVINWRRWKDKEIEEYKLTWGLD